MTDKLEARNACFNKIIEILGDKGRSMNTGDLKSQLHKIADKAFVKEQERSLFLDGVFKSLEEDFGMIKPISAHTRLTEKGYDVYKMKDRFFGYLEQKERERKEVQSARRMTIVSGRATVATFGVAFVSLVVSVFNTSPTANFITACAASFFIGIVSREVIRHLLRFFNS